MTSLLIDALNGKPTARPPVWLMRQAGRYMEQYRALKQRYDFLTLCKEPALAVEVSLQPVDEFRPDAAIIFSDILLPLEALGFSVAFNPGPVIQNPLTSAADLARVATDTSLDGLRPVLEAIRTLKGRLKPVPDGYDTALLGFIGAPWTLACYSTAAQGYKHFERAVILAKTAPREFESFLRHVSDALIAYAVEQHRAGADAIQVFDTWAGILSEDDYRRIALPHTQRVVAEIKRAGCPVISYIKDGAHLLAAQKDSGASCISLDWRIPIAKAERVLGEDFPIQGNLDPTDLFLPQDLLRQKVRTMVAGRTSRRAYIANLGHGVLINTPPDNVRVFIEAVRQGWEVTK